MRSGLLAKLQGLLASRHVSREPYPWSVRLSSKSAIRADFEPRVPVSLAHTASPSGALQIAPVGRDLLTPSGR